MEKTLIFLVIGSFESLPRGLFEDPDNVVVIIENIQATSHIWIFIIDIVLPISIICPIAQVCNGGNEKGFIPRPKLFFYREIVVLGAFEKKRGYSNICCVIGFV